MYASQASIAASRRRLGGDGQQLVDECPRRALRIGQRAQVDLRQVEPRHDQRLRRDLLDLATKFESYSNVFTTATLPVRSRSKMRGSLRETNRPSLDAGPGGNGVAGGVGVAVGSGEAVGVDGADMVGVSAGVAASVQASAAGT